MSPYAHVRKNRNCFLFFLKNGSNGQATIILKTNFSLVPRCSINKPINRSILARPPLYRTFISVLSFSVFEVRLSLGSGNKVFIYQLAFPNLFSVIYRFPVFFVSHTSPTTTKNNIIEDKWKNILNRDLSCVTYTRNRYEFLD